MIAHAASGKSSEHINTGSLWRLCGVLVLIFAYAAWQRFAIPLDPIADPDTWGYLSPALRKLTGAEFGHTYGRNFLYPGFLFLLLRVFGDFRAITIAQHFLGLLAGVIFLLTWRRLRVFVSNSLIAPSVHDGLGLVGAAIYLFASDTIQSEAQLRPEGVCGFLISVNLYVLIQFIASCFVERRRTAALTYGITTVFSSLLLASVKPSFWFVAIVALLPVSAFLFRPGWWREKIALTATAAVSAVLLLLPEHFLARSDEESRTFLPTTLFVIHADLIRDQMAADLKDNANVPYRRERLERVQAALSAEIAKSQAAHPGHYASLGFDPDFLMYNQGSIATQLRREFSNNISDLCSFYRFYYWRTWQHQPLRALEKVARQISIYYFPKCPAYSPMKLWSLTDVYQRGVTSLDTKPYRKTWTAYPPAVDFMRRTKLLAQKAPIIEQPRIIRWALSALAVSYLPWLLAALVLSTIIFWQPVRRKRLGWLATLVLLGFTYNAASCLEVAIVHSLEIHRYITVQMFATLLAQFLALWLTLEFALETRNRQRAAV